VRSKLYIFSLLNLADLFLTVQLLRQSNGEVYESNPLANWWLTHHGWMGLVLFKLVVVLSAAALFVVIACYRPRAGRRAILLACGILAAVVLYSGLLLCSLHLNTDKSLAQDLREAQAATQRCQKLLQDIREYAALRDQLSKELLAGRYTLKEASARLALTPRGQDPFWLKLLHAEYRGYSDQECRAADLLTYTLSNLTDEVDREQVARRLEKEFYNSLNSELLTFQLMTAKSLDGDSLKARTPGKLKPALAPTKSSRMTPNSESTTCE
jgi:hypothetical protein